jgi:hypothetical protein
MKLGPSLSRQVGGPLHALLLLQWCCRHCLPPFWQDLGCLCCCVAKQTTVVATHTEGHQLQAPLWVVQLMKHSISRWQFQPPVWCSSDSSSGSNVKYQEDTGAACTCSQVHLRCTISGCSCNWSKQRCYSCRAVDSSSRSSRTSRTQAELPGLRSSAFWP